MLQKIFQKFAARFINVKKRLNTNQQRLHEILFERNTRAGYIFERVLLIAIFASITIVMLESVGELNRHYPVFFATAEWFFTIFFTLEYILRLYCAYQPLKYATSFFGVIDLVSVVPTFIDALIPGAHAFLIIRILRVFRIFRLFKLIQFTGAGFTILTALKASRAKIMVFLMFVLTLVTIMGSFMYLIEGSSESGFTSIPRSIYWAIVTLTTVGYGDIAPVTELGQFVAAVVMLLGYAVLAVPTGIVSAEMNKASRAKEKAEEEEAISKIDCHRCGKEEHEPESRFCNRCGEKMVLSM